MKKYYLLGLVSMILLSCTKEDATITDTNSSEPQEIKVMSFSSIEELDKKQQSVYDLKEKLEKENISFYKSSGNSLTSYHEEKIRNIYKLRKELNFTSIQSIADEINSLTLLDKNKANQLFSKYQNFLIKKATGVETIFYQGSDFVNVEGEILIKGDELILDKKEVSLTGKYISDEAVKTGLVGSSEDFYVYYFAGRERHRNDIGAKFFRYFTELKSFVMTTNGLVSCPSTITIQSGSIAGFALSGSAFFADYSFTYPYIASGRYVGGKMNTAYVPAGGNIKGTFTTTIGTRTITFSADMKYQEK